MNWLRRVLANFGLARNVAKPIEPLIERADRAIEKVDTLRLEVVTKKDQVEARLRRLDLQSGRRPR